MNVTLYLLHVHLSQVHFDLVLSEDFMPIF
jgi:hypothetical protein